MNPIKAAAPIASVSGRTRASVVARLESDEQTAQRVGNLVGDRFAADDVAVSLSDAGGGRWQVAIHFRTAPDRDLVRAVVTAAVGRKRAAALHFTRTKPSDWVRHSLAALRPVVAGRFVVHGAHDRARIRANRIGIEIEAALAFGTGHHGTTRGCLLAIDRICGSLRARRRAWRILDLGTGSGVLAIAAARALRQRVLATDVDGAAVRVARANARLNGAGAMVEVVKADGVKAQQLRAQAPFNLIFANILLRPLQRLAAPLRLLAASDARLVLSGLLPAQANAAMTAYRPFALERRLELDGWTTLVLVRRTRRRRPDVARRRRGP
jgi:ribosomal protein L11 methyltransferase